LALATILQAYTGVSDDEVIECTTMDRRWQLVLDCLDVTKPPFSKPSLIAFRQRLMAAQADQRLLERTIERAATTKLVGSRQLRAALDRSPLWGAGRVEDTYNLLGHALQQAVRVIARQQGRGLIDTAAEVGITLAPDRSVKAALDLDWNDADASHVALTTILDALCRSRGQDVTLTEAGQPVLHQGVAAERRISLMDADLPDGRCGHVSV